MSSQLVTPGEAEALQPTRASVSSSDLRWKGIEVHVHTDAPAGQLVTPPCTHHTLILNRRRLDSLIQMRDGTTVERRLISGDFLLCPAGMPSRWRWKDRADVVGFYIAPELISRSAEDLIHGDPEQIKLSNSFGFRHAGLEQIASLLVDEVVNR